MEMWISKYVLSEGRIKKVTGHLNQYNSDYFHAAGYIGFKVGRDAHATEEASRAAAESMRVKKIASLRKQIAKLEGMKF